jgi:aspartyl-tRNA(Asn)/glutamyl-tRNA(Gln) amidotransferase subunit A
MISAFDNYFLQAQRVRQLVRNDFDRVFSLPNFYYSDPTSQQQKQSTTNADQVDVLIHPSAIRTAPPLIDENEEENDGVMNLDTYVQDVLTVPASLAGIPALSVPVPLKFLNMEEGGDGWPVGVSVVGQWGSEELVMRVGEVIEQMG